MSWFLIWEVKKLLPMKIDSFPEDIKPYIIPEIKGELYYQCLGCSADQSIDKLLLGMPRM